MTQNLLRYNTPQVFIDVLQNKFNEIINSLAADIYVLDTANNTRYAFSRLIITSTSIITTIFIQLAVYSKLFHNLAAMEKRLHFSVVQSAVLNCPAITIATFVQHLA